MPKSLCIAVALVGSYKLLVRCNIGIAFRRDPLELMQHLQQFGHTIYSECSIKLILQMKPIWQLSWATG
jgi:hypothetical protein